MSQYYATGGGASGPVKDSAFTAPAQTAVLFECLKSSPNLTNPLETGSWAFNGWNGASGNLATGTLDNEQGLATNTPRHFGGANWLAADGHVKFILPLNISAGRDAAKPTSAQNGIGQSEGAGYTGAGKHALTFAVR